MENKILVYSFYNGWVEVTEKRARKWCRVIRNGATNIPEEKKLDFINSRIKGIQFESLEEI